MKTVIKWHETAKELPETTKYKKTFENGKDLEWEVEEPLLVIYPKENRIKPTSYNPKTDTWVGHVKGDVPPYWVKIRELTWEEDDE